MQKLNKETDTEVFLSVLSKISTYRLKYTYLPAQCFFKLRLLFYFEVNSFL
jgi:hypothetical protein